MLFIFEKIAQTTSKLWGLLQSYTFELKKSSKDAMCATNILEASLTSI